MKQVSLYFFIISLLLQMNVYAENDAVEKLRAQPYISYKYRRGEHLIYDCKKRHYLCVNIDGFKRCSKERSVSIERKRQSMRCAPLKKFTTQKACFASVYKQIHSIKNKSFCFDQKTLNF